MMLLSEIAKLLNTQLLGADVTVTSVGTDSRNIAVGQLFVGIKGDNFDGSAYALQALNAGASAVIVSDKRTEARPALVVENTRLALGKIAQYWREKFTLPLVAITGSNGKTTIKEMITAILGESGSKTLATRGNLNNDIGMPLTLLGLQSFHTHAVIEMGMNHEGEIRYLSHLAGPNVAVISNAGTAHIGELGSREAIARAKGEIFEGMQDKGIAVINLDDDFAEYWQSLNLNRQSITFGLNPNADVSAHYQVHSDSIHMQLKTPAGEVACKLNVLGEHNVRNALAASAVAVALGISNAHIAKGLAQFSAVKGRLNRKPGIQGASVIDDTYNANPDSMKAALHVLAQYQGHTIYVMGDMGELGNDGEQMHTEIGAFAKQQNVSQLLCFGELSKKAAHAYGDNAKHFERINDLIEYLKTQMRAGVTVLVKGSRFMQMERVVNAVVSDKHIGGAH